MIVEFSVKNFRSIKDLQTISFVAAPLKSAPEYAEVDENNIVEEGGMRLLKTVGIYGPNSSGKSNIIKAFEYFLFFVCIPASPRPINNNLHQPFVYQDNHLESESFFQIVFIVAGKKYRYGFTIKNNRVINEWLFGISNKNMVSYFIRNGSKENIQIKEAFKEAEEIPLLEFDHTLFLTHAASFKKGEVHNIWSYLYSHTIPFTNRTDLRRITTNHINYQIAGKTGYKELMDLLDQFGINYDKIEIDESNHSSKVNEFDLEKILVTKHGTKLNMAINESDGVSKMFDLSGSVLISSRLGCLLIQDELDSNFHPSLLIKLIKMFNEPKKNTGKGQLLFTTHDTNLLNPAIMRRDQFYFTEKDKDDATRLYSLADLKGIRNDADFAKQYLAGYYGALPILDNYVDEKAGINE